MKRIPFSQTLRHFLLLSAIAGTVFSEVCVGAAESTWQAGFSKVVITPDEPMWLSGYGGRSKPAEGKVHDLYARAAALRDANGKTAVFISTDLIGVPIKMVGVVSKAVREKHGLERSDLMFTCSHTHCGPALDHKLSYMLDMNSDDWSQVKANQQQLNGKLIGLIDRAVSDLKPAKLSAAIGNCGFAANRRAPKGLGPYDHDVPVLRVTSPDGKTIRGLIFGYACHNTTLRFYQWCGDYAGFAQLYLEDRHPDAVAMFFTGCGADQNPLPRLKVSLAEKYGRMLGVSVDDALETEMQPVNGDLETAFREIDLEYHQLLSAAELAQQAETGNRYSKARAGLLLNELEAHGELAKSYPYPIQVWKLGNAVTWVALGGEVVVDYSLRLKKELGQGQTWVTGYANDVMAYIPSERVLTEGGYEGESSMIYYQLPSKWKTGLEDQIVKTVLELSRKKVFPIKTSWGEIRCGAKQLELHVAKIPENRIVSVPRLNNPIGKVYLKGDAKKSPVGLKPEISRWNITLPKTASAGVVVVLETKGRAFVPSVPQVIAQSEGGAITLPAHSAVVHGKMLRYEPQPHKNTVGYWVNEKDTCEWQFNVTKPGKFEVQILQGCGKGQGGSKVAISVAKQSVTFTVEDTGHFQKFKRRSIGTITIAKAGNFKLMIKPLSKAKNAIMDVREIKLLPRGK